MLPGFAGRRAYTWFTRSHTYMRLMLMIMREGTRSIHAAGASGRGKEDDHVHAVETVQ